VLWPFRKRKGMEAFGVRRKGATTLGRLHPEEEASRAGPVRQ
jgi:hypothetical protein